MKEFPDKYVRAFLASLLSLVHCQVSIALPGSFATLRYWNTL